MSLESQFSSKVLLEKIEPVTVIKNEPEIGMDQDIISADIKDEIDIAYHLLSEDLIKSEPIPNNLLESEHLESVETQIFIQTENSTTFENLVKTQGANNGNLSVVSGSTYKKTKAKMGNCHLTYNCNKCKWLPCLKRHKIIEIQSFYCYHCPYKSNYKRALQCHIFRHFKNGEVPFHCYICDFVTSKRNLIIKHFKKHPEHRSKWNKTEYKNQVEDYFKKRRRYYCKKCEFKTQKYANFKLHELSHEAERDDQHLKYRCDQCKYKTFRSGNLKKHKLIHLKPEEIQYFYCYHCSYKAKQKGHLKRHILRHFKYEKVPFHCYICDFVTRKRDLIIEHFKKHPEHISKYELTQESKVKMNGQYLKYQCDKCSYKTFRKQNFEQHKLIHLKPEEIQWFYCYHCSYKSNRKSQLKDHILRHFKNKEVPFHCYICDFVTKKRDLIIEHFMKHPERVSKCDETNYEINLKLTQYIKKRYELAQKSEVEMDDQHLKHQCDKCTYKTDRKSKLNRHKLIHLEPEEIQYLYCYHCCYKAKIKCHLKDHILGHFKRREVPFHCYICDFVTNKRDLIFKHFKKHPKHISKYELTQESKVEVDDQYLKHQCDKCTYKTFHKGTFNQHKLIHLKPEEIQWFYCYHCSYKAKQKSHLIAHILRHFKNEVVEFHCYMCDFMTVKRKSITKHIKKHSKVQVKSKINQIIK